MMYHHTLHTTIGHCELRGRSWWNYCTNFVASSTHKVYSGDKVVVCTSIRAIFVLCVAWRCPKPNKSTLHTDSHPYHSCCGYCRLVCTDGGKASKDVYHFKTFCSQNWGGNSRSVATSTKGNIRFAPVNIQLYKICSYTVQKVMCILVRVQ